MKKKKFTVRLSEDLIFKAKLDAVRMRLNLEKWADYAFSLALKQKSK